MQHQIVRGDIVPIAEQTLQGPAHHPATQPASHGSEWQGIVNLINEGALRRAHRHEAVAMFPACERPDNLGIAELLARLMIVMAGDPAMPKSRSADAQDDFAT